ncbi:MAG: hypothetical protein ACUVXB_08020 [Bryobacteraceae bacterium]
MRYKFAAGPGLLTLAVFAVPMIAQSYKIEAAVPFSFAIGSHALPAGHYEIQRLSRDVVKIWSSDTKKSVAVMFQPASMPSRTADGAVTPVFHRYEEAHILAEIRNGWSASVYLFSEAQWERELRTASAGRPHEILTVLALTGFGER